MAYGPDDYDSYNPYGGTQPYSSGYGGSSKPVPTSSTQAPVTAPTTQTSTPVASGAATQGKGEGFDFAKLFGSGQGGGGWGGVAMQQMNTIAGTVDAFNKAARAEQMLKAMSSGNQPFMRESVQGVADLSATINDLRHGQLGARNEQRVGADVARRMGARGIGGAAAQLSSQNAIESARDNYNQWRLDKLANYIQLRQGIAEKLQQQALAERAARIAAAQAHLDKYGAVGRLLGRNILGSIGGFVGSVFGGSEGGAAGAQAGAGTSDLLQMLVNASMENDPMYQQYWKVARGPDPVNWVAEYEKDYANGGR